MRKKLLIVLSVLMISSMGMTVSASESNYTLTEEEIINEQREELRKIWDDYGIDSKYSNSTMPYIDSIGGNGDILIALDSVTYHVGIVKDTFTVIEAHPDNPNGGVDYRDNDWPSRYNSIKGLKVDGIMVQLSRQKFKIFIMN